MAARAIWKGRLVLGEHVVPVKMYSAVQDRKVHFHLLHGKDLSPVQQRIVRKSDGKEVPKEDRRKAVPVDADEAVILQPDELEQIEPPPSRDIDFCRFVPVAAIGDQWYDRPYYLGPDEDDADYFALTAALERRKVAGIARWAMRKKRYVGALRAMDGYLLMLTLRRSDQVLSVSGIDVPAARRPDEKEIALARQLVSSIEADFDPAMWHDEYRERVTKLIEEKARGETIEAPPPKPKPAGDDLAAALRMSLGAVKERKVA